MSATPISSAAPVPRVPQPLLVLLAALGIVAFLYGITQGQPLRTWSIYLINLLFCSSGGPVSPAMCKA